MDKYVVKQILTKSRKPVTVDHFLKPLFIPTIASCYSHISRVNMRFSKLTLKNTNTFYAIN